MISAVLAVTLSAGGAAAWALDRFVVPHAEITNVSEYEASQAGTTTANSTTTDTASADTSASAVVTDTSYTARQHGCHHLHRDHRQR